jgi:LAO/AO transport system ATPase
VSRERPGGICPAVGGDESPLVAALLAGERRALARAISAIENGAPGCEAIAAAIAGRRGRAQVIGVTGAAGAGKSTLINSLLGELLARGRRVGVVAVDPSSPLTGGAVLGDRVRMGEHGAHERVFIRSIAARGHLGGVSRTTAQIVDALDAAGFDPVIVETVGAGQSEVEIIDIADTRVVICPPGLGDDVQAIKAGILEIADLLVVNKADLPEADRTVRELKEMLRLRARRRDQVPVLATCATRNEGIAALADALARHAATAGVGRRIVEARRPSADDVAAVDRAMRARHAAVNFLPRPVGRQTVEQIVEAAGAALAAASANCHVLALGGGALQRLRAAIAPADGGKGSDVERALDAPAALIVSVDGPAEPDRLLAGGKLLQVLAIAAAARGLAAREATLRPQQAALIACHLALADHAAVVSVLAIGHADADAHAVPPAMGAGSLARLEGFDCSR